jgi:hypothetical protein
MTEQCTLLCFINVKSGLLLLLYLEIFLIENSGYESGKLIYNDFFASNQFTAFTFFNEWLIIFGLEVFEEIVATALIAQLHLRFYQMLCLLWLFEFEDHEMFFLFFGLADSRKFNFQTKKSIVILTHMAHNISIISSSIRTGIQTISWINTRLTDYISYTKINACLNDHCFCDWRLTGTRLLNSQRKCWILFHAVVN